MLDRVNDVIFLLHCKGFTPTSIMAVYIAS